MQEMQEQEMQEQEMQEREQEQEQEQKQQEQEKVKEPKHGEHYQPLKPTRNSGSPNDPGMYSEDPPH